MCHGLTKVHVSVNFFNDVTLYGTGDVMKVSFSITLVLFRFKLRPIAVLARCMAVSMLSSSSEELPTGTISSANIKCDGQREG